MRLQEFLDRNKNVATPDHYAGGRRFEPKDVIRDYNLNFNLGNAVKYISRAGRKDDNSTLQDLEKALQYLEFERMALDKECDRDGFYLFIMPEEYTEGAVIDDWDLPFDLGRALSEIFETRQLAIPMDKIERINEAAKYILSYLEDNVLFEHIVIDW